MEMYTGKACKKRNLVKNEKTSTTPSGGGPLWSQKSLAANLHMLAASTTPKYGQNRKKKHKIFINTVLKIIFSKAIFIGLPTYLLKPSKTGNKQ